jgi:hypothetical protein
MPPFQSPDPADAAIPHLMLADGARRDALVARLLDRLNALDDQGLMDSCEADDADDALALIRGGAGDAFPATIAIPSSNALRALSHVLDPDEPGVTLRDPVHAA